MTTPFAFNLIPADLRVPGTRVEIDASQAQVGTPTLPSRVLVIGSRLAAGTVAEGVLRRVTSDGQSELWWGKGSMLDAMTKVVRGHSAQARLVEVWNIAIDDDGGAVAATGTITLVGAATEDGVLDVRVAGRRVRTAISSGDNETAAAAAVVASDHTDTPTSVGNVAGVITYTARNAGEAGNDIDIRVDVIPAGLTATVVPMASGATNPDVTATIALITAKQWTSIISNYNDDANLDLLEAEMDRRDGPLVDQPGHVFAGLTDELAAALIFGAARNSRHSTIIHLRASPSPPWELAAWGTMVDEIESDPARPRNRRGGTVRPSSGADVDGIAPPDPTARLIDEDHESLLRSGITPLQSDDFDKITTIRMITTNQLDDLGNASKTFLDITTPRTLDALRFTAKLFFGKFNDFKLQDDPLTLPLANVMTPNGAKAQMILLHDSQWVPNGWVESAGRAEFVDTMIATRPDDDVNRIDIQVSPDLVNGNHITAIQLAFRL